MPKNRKRKAVDKGVDKLSKSKKAATGSDQPDYKDELQDLFDGIAENDRTKVERQLEVLPRKPLSDLLIPSKKGKESSATPLKQKKRAAGRSKKGTSDDSHWTDWMKEDCMPWNPSRKFDAASYRCTCLHLAAVLGHPQFCRLLLDKGAELNVRDTASNPVLLLAAASGDAETVKVFIAAGSLASEENDQGVTALCVACKQGNAEVVEILLQQPGIQINKESSFMDEIPLFCAAFFGHIKVVELLLQNGADVNKTTERQLTAVHMAARRSNLDMIDFLAKNGASVTGLSLIRKNTRQKLRFKFEDSEICSGSPLSFAVNSTHDGSSVKVLLSHGADVEAVYRHQPRTPLMVAAAKCNISVAQLLLDAGAKIDRPDLEQAFSPLLTAICSYHPGGWKAMEAKILECVKFLVEAGASVEAVGGGTEQNCLHLAVQYELHEVFAYLLEKGADPWEFDHHDHSAVKHCLKGHCGNPRPWVLKCLQAGVLNLDSMVDFLFGMKPLDYAVLNSDLHLIKMYEEAGLLHQECLSEDMRNVSEGYTYFESAVKNVLPLKNICRRVISDQIGERPGRCVGITTLPVEGKMKRFLLYEDLLPLLEPPPPRFVEFLGGSMQVNHDKPVHTMTDRELIQERGSESEVDQLESDSEFDSESEGSGSSYEWPEWTYHSDSSESETKVKNEVAQLESEFDSESGGSGSSYEWPEWACHGESESETDDDAD